MATLLFNTDTIKEMNKQIICTELYAKYQLKRKLFEMKSVGVQALVAPICNYVETGYIPSLTDVFLGLTLPTIATPELDLDAQFDIWDDTIITACTVKHSLTAKAIKEQFDPSITQNLGTIPPLSAIGGDFLGSISTAYSDAASELDNFTTQVNSLLTATDQLVMSAFDVMVESVAKLGLGKLKAEVIEIYNCGVSVGCSQFSGEDISSISSFPVDSDGNFILSELKNFCSSSFPTVMDDAVALYTAYVAERDKFVA